MLVKNGIHKSYLGGTSSGLGFCRRILKKFLYTGHKLSFCRHDTGLEFLKRIRREQQMFTRTDALLSDDRKLFKKKKTHACNFRFRTRPPPLLSSPHTIYSRPQTDVRTNEQTNKQTNKWMDEMEPRMYRYQPSFCFFTNNFFCFRTTNETHGSAPPPLSLSLSLPRPRERERERGAGRERENVTNPTFRNLNIIITDMFNNNNNNDDEDEKPVSALIASSTE